jgi:cytochrome c-type biogenesis protein
MFEIVTGIFMVVIGILIFTNSLVLISRYTSAWFGE